MQQTDEQVLSADARSAASATPTMRSRQNPSRISSSPNQDLTKRHASLDRARLKEILSFVGSSPCPGTSALFSKSRAWLRGSRKCRITL